MLNSQTTASQMQRRSSIDNYDHYDEINNSTSVRSAKKRRLQRNYLHSPSFTRQMLNSGEPGDYSIASLVSPMQQHAPQKTAVNQHGRRMHRFASPSERSDIQVQDEETPEQHGYSIDMRVSQPNSVMIGASSIADI